MSIDKTSAGSGTENDIADVVELDAFIRGGAGDGNGGGLSGDVNAVIDVDDFSTFHWYVGGGGSSEGAFNGGGAGSIFEGENGNRGSGGGGASEIRVGPDDTTQRVILVGGGGGGGEKSDGTVTSGGDSISDGSTLDGEDGEGTNGGIGGTSQNNGGGGFDQLNGEDTDNTSSYGGAGGGGYWSGSAGEEGDGGGAGATFLDLNSAQQYSIKNYTLDAPDSRFQDPGNDGRVEVTYRNANIPSIASLDSTYVRGEQINPEANTSETGYYDISTREWDLDNGDTVTGEFPSFEYTNAGVYTVTLAMTDTEGYTRSTTQDVTIEDAANVDFDVPADIIQGFEETFTDQTTYNQSTSAEAERWFVDGNEVATTTDLSNYAFDSPGDKIVKKEVEVEGIIYSNSETVSVQDAATVDYTYNTPVVAGIEHDFTDDTTVVSGSTRSLDEWILDGNKISESINLTYTFDTAGDKNLAKAVTVNGYKYGYDETITVQENTDAAFSWSPLEPIDGEQVQFTDESTSPFTIDSYSWDFDDGSTSTAQNPTHTFSSVGLYDVSLTITDSEGQTFTETNTVQVVSDEPRVNTDPASGIGDFEATLNGFITDIGTTDSSDFYFEYRQQGNTTWNSTPIQTFSNTGTYNETVTGLEIGTTYEYRAVGENANGTNTGATETFSTNSNTPPVVDSFSTTPSTLQIDTATDISFSASDQVGINEIVVEWNYGGSVQNSQTFTYSAATSVSETLTGFYTPTQFGTHTIELTLTDDKGASTSESYIRELPADQPTITLQSPSDGGKLQYGEPFDYEFSVSTGNAAITSGQLNVLNASDNNVRSESLGSVSRNSSQSFSFASNLTESSGDYTWSVTVDYEGGNSTNSPTRSFTVTEPSEAQVETGDLINIDGDLKGFTFINVEGGLIFTGDSSTIDLYFQYRKSGESAWNESSRQQYDAGN